MGRYQGVIGRRPKGSPMRLLVTGNQGFIGPVLVAMAKARGHAVTGLDVGYFADCIARPEAAAWPDRQILRDMRDVTPADLEGVDAVIHLAGLSNDPIGERGPRRAGGGGRGAARN